MMNPSLRMARVALSRPVGSSSIAVPSRAFSIIGDAIGKFTSSRVENTKGKLLHRCPVLCNLHFFFCVLLHALLYDFKLE